MSEPIRELYIWGWSVHLRPILCLSQSESCTFEADPYTWGWSMSEPIRELYIWGRSVHLRLICVWANQRAVHLRPICTFEADLYIWGRFNLFSHVICLSQSENRICTFEADSVLYIWGQSERKSASNVQIGLKCTYIEADFSKADKQMRWIRCAINPWFLVWGYIDSFCW